MTDDEVDSVILWDVKVSGGRLALMGATERQICQAWLETLRRMDEDRAFPVMDHLPFPLN